MPCYAKVARRGTLSSAGGAAACSVYVTGVPADASEAELDAHFGKVGPVGRVKLYCDVSGRPKGDALVTYVKDASVIGAVQLLHTQELRVAQQSIA